MEENEVLKPRNSLEVVRWLIFEPELLRDYSDTVKGRGARLRAMLMPMIWIALGSFVLYLLGTLLIAGLELPMRFPSQYKETVTGNWSGEFWTDTLMLFDLGIKEFLLCLAFGWFIPFIVWKRGLAFVLAFGRGIALPLGLLFGFAVGCKGALLNELIPIFRGEMRSGTLIAFILGSGFGIGFGLAFDLMIVSEFNSLRIRLINWGISLMGGLAFGLTGGLVGALSFLGGWFFFYYRTHFYLTYALCGFFQKYSFEKNPHLFDGGIYFPLWGIAADFQKQAFEYPEKGVLFSRFLFKRRRIQKQMAWQIQLASIAGEWRKKRLHPAMLKAFPDMDEVSVWYEDQFGLINRGRKVVPLPSFDWQSQIEATQQCLLEFEQESNVQIRVAYFRRFITELDKLYDLALRQPPSWGQYFVKALELWQKSATEKLRDLELEAQAEEPIVANIYRGGEKLRPDDKALFLGRSDLRDAFKKRVVTAVQMPLFFIQGQRRVGKSSMIAFLPTILDRGFSVVAYDMQEQPGLALPVLLEKILERVRSTLGIGKTPPPLAQVVDSDIQDLVPDAPEQHSGIQTSWLDAWQHFRTEFEAIADQHPAKIVLAIDEYEDFHRILQSDPTQGDALLAAMRAYSQSQNRVVFLFAGADYFSELKNPDWGNYFVQAERLLVGYLDHDDSLKLIQLVDLRYPHELLERMYDETQGHPCLLQKICREVVTIVNKTGRVSRAVTEADYDAAIKKEILKPDDGVMSIFWGQFCENRGLKPVVRQILAGEIPSDERALLVLEDHGFIVREGSQIRLRVPLFEQWLRRYQVM